MIALLIQFLMFITPAISAATLALKVAELKQAGISMAWPSVKAKITDSKIYPTGKKYKGQNLYRSEVTLAYAIEEQPYTVKQQPADDSGLTEGPKQWARQMSLQYKPDTAVRLYYNPNRPKQATLQPGTTSIDSSKWMVLGAVMLLFSFGLHILSVLAMTQRFLTISSGSSFILACITFIVMLILGALIFLLSQEMGQNKTV